eukprot:TRINITY_DN10806_c0_g1_i4.p1 TRINITY_DN10806_c0_g1~~TRINITY_DN10806_c0_g1_i4.p1  ORF type:complete len:752 (-),score=127.02 TRINITY_DN10806_c0_g1_i4:328-2583(-)
MQGKCDSFCATCRRSNKGSKARVGPVANDGNAGPDCAKCRPQEADMDKSGSASQATRWFKWMLTETMGAPTAFAFYRKEMQQYSKGDDDIEADDVTDYILYQTVTEGGLFFEYLRQGGLVAQADNALFVHGGLGKCIMKDEERFRAPAPNEQANLMLDLMMVAKDRARDPIDSYEYFAITAWGYVNAVHAWKQRRFAEWKQNPYFQNTDLVTHLKDSKCGTEKFCRRGEALMDLAYSPPEADGTPRNGGFSACSPVSASSVRPLDEETAAFLLKMRISHIFVGHIPQGATPRTYVTELPDGSKVTVVNMDVTFAHPVPSCTPDEGPDGGKPWQRCIRTVSPLVSYDVASQESKTVGLIATSTGKAVKILAYSNGDKQQSWEELAVTALAGPGSSNPEGPPGTRDGEGQPWFSGYIHDEVAMDTLSSGTDATSSRLPPSLWRSVWSGKLFSAPRAKLWTTIDSEAHRYAIRLFESDCGCRIESKLTLHHSEDEVKAAVKHAVCDRKEFTKSVAYRGWFIGVDRAIWNAKPNPQESPAEFVHRMLLKEAPPKQVKRRLCSTRAIAKFLVHGNITELQGTGELSDRQFGDLEGSPRLDETAVLKLRMEDGEICSGIGVGGNCARHFKESKDIKCLLRSPEQGPDYALLDKLPAKIVISETHKQTANVFMDGCPRDPEYQAVLVPAVQEFDHESPPDPDEDVDAAKPTSTSKPAPETSTSETPHSVGSRKAGQPRLAYLTILSALALPAFWERFF